MATAAAAPPIRPMKWESGIAEEGDLVPFRQEKREHLGRACDPGEERNRFCDKPLTWKTAVEQLNSCLSGKNLCPSGKKSVPLRQDPVPLRQDPVPFRQETVS